MPKLTNLLSNGDFENTGWSGGSYDTAHALFGAYSYKMTGTASTAEVLANHSGNISMVSGHIYYVRWYVYHEGAPGSTGCYFGIWEPSMQDGMPLGPAGQWNRISIRNSRPQSGSQGIRFDYNNGNQAGVVWFDGAMLIDLTAAFGSGSEPSKEWCDANIPDFTDTATVDAQAHTYRHVEYIEGSANQHIDMRFKGRGQYTTIEVDVQNVGDTECIFGARTAQSSTNAQSFALFAIDANSWRLDRLGSSHSISASTTTRRLVRLEPTPILIDGNATSLPTKTTSSTLSTLLASVDNNGEPDTRSAIRIYGCRVWDGDVLIRDYVPAVRDDGVAGLLDDVLGYFHPSEGTAQFSAGPSYWAVSVGSSDGVTITPSASEVLNGGSVTFTVTPAEGRAVASFTVNGSPYTVPREGGQVTITNVTSDLTATATSETLMPPIVGTSLSVSLQPNPAATSETLLATVSVQSVSSYYYTLPATAWEGTGPYEMTMAVDESIVPDADCLAYGDHSMTLEQRVAEYNGVIRAEITQAGRVRFRALSIKPTQSVAVRIINGLFPVMLSASVPVSQWAGTGPWTATVNLGRSVQSAVVGAVSGASDAQASDLMDAGIHVSAVNGSTITLRAMLAKPTVDLKVGVLAI